MSATTRAPAGLDVEHPTNGRPATVDPRHPLADDGKLEPNGRWASFTPGVTAGEFFSRGIVAGLAAGLVFVLIEMAWLSHLGKPAVAPLLAFSTIFTGASAPTAIAAQIPLDAITGFVVHLNLAMAFGLGFLPIVALLARIRRSNAAMLAVAGLAYGCLLYVINFGIFSSIAFPAFTAPGSPQGFLFLVHALYGLLLAPFFIGMLRRLRPR